MLQRVPYLAKSSKLYEDTSLVEFCLFTSVNNRELSMDVIDETDVRPLANSK